MEQGWADEHTCSSGRERRREGKVSKVSCDVRYRERGEGVEGRLEARGMIGRGREGKVFKISLRLGG